MKKTNKLISILLVLAMLLSMAPMTVLAATVEASGKFGASGSNLTWSLDSDGVLTVSGSGAMEDFASVSKVPWYSKITKVKTVVIESGVTNIGKDAFYGISSLVNATISDTVTSIGNRAFSGSGLTNFEFSDAGNLKTIGNAAFSNTQIKNMVIPDGVTTLGSYVFGYGPIKSVTIPASVTSIGNYFFEETSGLNEVIFLGNKEPETIGNTVFLGCSSLAYVSVPADYEGDTFSNMKVSKATASVAEVNGQGFATLADAISAAQSINGAVLKLLSHISIDSGITIESGNFTIDLNGKELFSNGYFLLRIDGADVTIVDSAGGGVFNATNDQGNIVLEVLSGSANILGGTFNSASYPATVRDGTLKLTGKDFVLNGNWRIGWYGGSIDLSACTADEVRIQACADGLQASAVTLPDGWGLFKTNGTPCTDFVKNDIYVAKAGFKVTASVNPTEGGTVEGAGTYSSGATVTLTATAANGYRFVNWTQSGEEVNTSAVYTFTASKNRELTANFEIVPHTHSFTYSASGDTITAVCANADGNCPDPEGTLTILAPADLYVDGTAKEATVENNLPDASAAVGDITYSTVAGSAPITAGTHFASVTVGGATATVKFTLIKYPAMVTDKDGNELSDSPYKTLADAITAASASEGSTVTLLDDIALTDMLEITLGKFTLDINGKTIINPDGIEIGSAAELTIVDSASDGKIFGDMFGFLNDGSLIINGGIIDASCAVYNYGTVNIVDGDIQGTITNNGKVTVNGGTLTYIENVNTSHVAVLEINGGTFTSSNTIGNNDGEIIVKGGIYPNGFSVINDGVLENTANSVLADGCYFRDAENRIITVADGATAIKGYVKVTKGADLSEAVITLDKIDFIYNGNEIKPTVIVTIGGKTLTEETDYTVSYANNINAGTATVTVKGIGQAAGGIAGGGGNIGNSSNAGEVAESSYTGEIIREYTIAPLPVDIIWEGDSFYYTGKPHTVTAKFVDVNGDENPAAITQNKTNTEIGKYIATATVEDSNYTVNGATINHAYEIKWYDKSPAPEIDGQKGENGWYTSAVTVTAPEGYTISTAVDGTYGREITLGNEENAVCYLKQAETGYIAKFELGKFAVDRNDPTAEIIMAENKWNSFFNAVTFGKFFKETQSITITASDETSGLAKIEYFVSTEEITDFENIEWIEYSEAFTIQPSSKNIIYAKATDNAGRYAIVNSDGIVLYTDSTLDTLFKDEVVYVLTKNADQSFNLNLNGNTVAYVKIDETVLDAENYEVLGNMIMVSDEILENLAAGEYVITVGFNPMGEEFVDGDAPAEVTIPLTVKKADVTVEIKDFGKVYDGKLVTADYEISKSSDSSPAVSDIDYNETVEFKAKDADDGTYTTEAPVNAGEYTVRITVAETDKINSAEATADFTIAKKSVTVTATAPDKVYDGTTDVLEYSEVIVKINGAVEGEMLGFTVGKAWYDSADAGTDKVVHIIYDPVASNSIDNYEIPVNPEYSTDNYYVATTADISRKDISDGFIILGEALIYNGKEQTQTVEKVLPTGTAPEATYTVSGNKATNVGVYLLTVTGTGNFTGEAKIAYEIAVDTKCVSHIELVYTQINGVYERVWKVKSTDRESLEYVLDQLNNAVTDIAPGNKKERWNEMKADCEEILGIINSIEFFIADVEEDYAGFSEDTVKSSDVPALDELAGKINAFKERYVYNLTDEEEKKLEDILDGIEKLKEKIAETEQQLEEIKDIENNYNPENISSDDKAAIEDKIAEIESVNPDNLTDEQKAEYEEIKAGLEALLEEIAAAEKDVADIGVELEMFDEERVTKFWEDDIEALKAKIDELLADENMGETEKAKLNEYKAQAEKLIEIINTPKEYFSLRFFYLIWDCLTWKYNGILWLFSKIFTY